MPLPTLPPAATDTDPSRNDAALIPEPPTTPSTPGGHPASWRPWRSARPGGGFVAWWTPRGPLTTGLAIASIVVALVVGVAAGLIAKSRWAMLIVPLTFVLVFELLRIDLVGPAPRWRPTGTTWG